MKLREYMKLTKKQNEELIWKPNMRWEIVDDPVKSKMDRSTVIYGYCLMIRNKLVYCLDWLLMQVHTTLTGIKHNGADPKIKL